VKRQQNVFEMENHFEEHMQTDESVASIEVKGEIC
jgi:hypothetical protein